MIDVVIIRDPDFGNDIHVFGDTRGLVATFDLDLGRADLRDPDEFAEWAENLAIDARYTVNGAAATLIASVVRNVGESYGHQIPEWAA
jgi:pantothenate kinase type III